MTTSYLLPCDCGQKVVVQPRQAGQEVRCACGRPLEVPTMLKMARLQPVESPAQTSRPSAPWGWRQGIILLGIAILLGSIVAGVGVAGSRPQPPRLFDAEAIREASQNLTPVQSWQLWRSYRAGGLDRERLALDEIYHEENRKWWLNVGSVLAVALVGLGLIVVPLLVRRRPQAASA